MKSTAHWNSAASSIRTAIGLLKKYEKTNTGYGGYWNSGRCGAGLTGRREVRRRAVRGECDREVGNDRLDRARRRGNAAAIGPRHDIAGSCTACSGNHFHFTAAQHAVRVQHLLAG